MNLPLSDHQLWMVHMKRKLSKKLSKGGYKRVTKLLREVKGSSNCEEAKGHWERVVRLVMEEKTADGFEV